jgi:peptidoglycan hydrolase-like protein with peptidoglycan-binding domain
MAGTTNKSWDGSAGRFTDQQYARSCLIKRSGTGSIKERCSLPVREPDGTLNLNALPAAAGRLGGTQGLSDSERRAAARKLMGLYSANKMDPPAKLLKAAGQEPSKERKEAGLEEGPEVLSGELGQTPTPSTSPRIPRRASGLTIRKGMAGAGVKQVQAKLAKELWDVAVDGSFGPKTEHAVRAFQDINDLNEDGIVGRETMAKLNGERTQTPGPLRASHVRMLGMSLARRGGGKRRRLSASGEEETGDAAHELIETDAWSSFSRELAEVFMPGGGGSGEESLGGATDPDNDGVPDDEDMADAKIEGIAPGTGTIGAPSARVRLAQTALASAGHDPGTPDGVYGPKTIGAVKSFQAAVGGLRPHGHLDGATLESLDATSGTQLVESMQRSADRRRELVA